MGRQAKGPAEVQLVAVQWKVDPAVYTSEEGFGRKVEAVMEQVGRRISPNIPALVAFPEDVGTPLVFLGAADLLRRHSTLQGMMAALIKRSFLGVSQRRLLHRVSWTRALALQLAPRIAPVYFRVFQEAARRHRVTLVAGSVLLPEVDWEAGGRPRGADVFNVSYVFGPDGQLLGTQRKVNLIDLEGPKGLDITPAPRKALRVLETPVGPLGVAICFDAFFEEVVEGLVDGGARILVQPSANPGPWNDWQQEDWMRGSFSAVRRWSRLAYAVNPMMVGDLLDLRFEGQSSICAADRALARPLGYASRPQSAEGFVAVASSWDEEEVLYARVPGI